MDIIKVLTEEFSLSLTHVKNIVELIDGGNTIPFIARYRKELTGSIDDQVLRKLADRLTYLRGLAERKDAVIRIIEEQGKLTEELKAGILSARTMQEVEDLYRPYKQKRRTRATIAREKGLEPLAEIILSQSITEGTIEDIAAPYIDEEKGVSTVEDAVSGAMDIIAETLSDNADFRKQIRKATVEKGVVVSKAKTAEDSVYAMYYDFREPVRTIANHRILALNRGEKEGFLSVSIDAPEDEIISFMDGETLLERYSITKEYVKNAIVDSYARLIKPSIENEIRNALTEEASEKGIELFSENLKNLLMQPPIKERTVLGLDPAYRTGCKIAVVDEASRVITTTVIYPTPPQNKTEEAKRIIKELICRHNIEIIAIGNGTASRESEIFVADVIKELDKKVFYMVVNESGASVYSASKLGAEEFPDFDVSLRSAVSIARRLIDPLSELVKIDPKSIGVGQYQHDMNQKRLDESLTGVVEDCVNKVGVNLNTASYSLLSYISGISAALSKNIVAYREENGGFTSRTQLKKVPKLGSKTYTQCAGFLRISSSENILDNTAVHPESYDAAKKLLDLTGFTAADVKNQKLGGLSEAVNAKGKEKIAKKLGIGVPTLLDIITELSKPGRDIRDELPKPELSSHILDIKDLKPDMILKGTVRNVIDFGAFVDIGVHQDGLVHISQLSDKFVRHPTEVVKLGDIVTVKVIDVDIAKKRISLTMKGLN